MSDLLSAFRPNVDIGQTGSTCRPRTMIRHVTASTRFGRTGRHFIPPMHVGARRASSSESGDQDRLALGLSFFTCNVRQFCSVQLGEGGVGGPPTAQLIFVFLGVGIGAVVPSLFVGAFVILSEDGNFLVGPHRWMSAKSWYVVGMLLCVVGFILALVGILTNVGWTNFLMLSAGALCVLSLEAFVISTGGPILSVFSFYYLYIPVVVGITFPPISLFSPAWSAGLCALPHFC